MPLEPSSFVLKALATISKSAWTAWQQQRIDGKRQILFEELSAGKIHVMHAIDQDELFACFHRFDRAAIEGSAHYKLQLMARVLRGQIEGGCLIADEFQTFAEIIASLREPELKYISALYSAEQQFPEAWTTDDGSKPLRDKLVAELIPKVFTSVEEMNAVGTALQRTALVMSGGITWNGEILFRTTPLMKTFVDLARLEPESEVRPGRTDPTF